MKDCSVIKRLVLLCMSLMLCAAPTQVNAQRILTEGESEETTFPDLTKVDVRYEQDLSWRMVCNTSAYYFGKDTMELNYYLDMAPFKFSVAGLSTFIHESLHHFNYGYALHDATNSSYYIDSSTVLQVPRYSGKVMSAEVLKRFADPLMPDAFDETYILNAKSALGNSGIYGLLGELSSYGQNRVFLNQIYPLLDTLEYVNNATFWKNVQLEHENQLLAYYKFNVYISRYLQAAKGSDTAFYNHLMGNIPLRKAYTAVDHKFHQALLQSNDLFANTPKNGHLAISPEPTQFKSLIQQTQATFNQDDVQQLLKAFAYEQGK